LLLAPFFIQIDYKKYRDSIAMREPFCLFLDFISMVHLIPA
jgi:hypothetical protein